MKNLITIISFFFILFACSSKQEKEVQSNLNVLNGTWDITAFEVIGTAPDSLKTYFKQGSLTFDACEYSEKSFKDESRVCGGTGTLNGATIRFTHRYFKNATPFRLSMSLVDKKPSQADIPAWLTYGQWEFMVEGNVLRAKQLFNETFPNARVEFTASKH